MYICKDRSKRNGRCGRAIVTGGGSQDIKNRTNKAMAAFGGLWEKYGVQQT